MLFTVGHANQTPTLQRKTRAQSSLKVGSVVIENQTNELLKVFIEGWDRTRVRQANKCWKRRFYEIRVHPTATGWTPSVR